MVLTLSSTLNHLDVMLWYRCATITLIACSVNIFQVKCKKTKMLLYTRPRTPDDSTDQSDGSESIISGPTAQRQYKRRVCNRNAKLLVPSDSPTHLEFDAGPVLVQDTQIGWGMHHNLICNTNPVAAPSSAVNAAVHDVGEIGEVVPDTEEFFSCDNQAMLEEFSQPFDESPQHSVCGSPRSMDVDSETIAADAEVSEIFRSQTRARYCEDDVNYEPPPVFGDKIQTDSTYKGTTAAKNSSAFKHPGYISTDYGSAGRKAEPKQRGGGHTATNPLIRPGVQSKPGSLDGFVMRASQMEADGISADSSQVKFNFVRAKRVPTAGAAGHLPTQFQPDYRKIIEERNVKQEAWRSKFSHLVKPKEKAEKVVKQGDKKPRQKRKHKSADKKDKRDPM